MVMNSKCVGLALLFAVKAGKHKPLRGFRIKFIFRNNTPLIKFQQIVSVNCKIIVERYIFIYYNQHKQYLKFFQEQYCKILILSEVFYDFM